MTPATCLLASKIASTFLRNEVWAKLDIKEPKAHALKDHVPLDLYPRPGHRRPTGDRSACRSAVAPTLQCASPPLEHRWPFAWISLWRGSKLRIALLREVAILEEFVAGVCSTPAGHCVVLSETPYREKGLTENPHREKGLTVTHRSLKSCIKDTSLGLYPTATLTPKALSSQLAQH